MFRFPTRFLVGQAVRVGLSRVQAPGWHDYPKRGCDIKNLKINDFLGLVGPGPCGPWFSSVGSDSLVLGASSVRFGFVSVRVGHERRPQAIATSHGHGSRPLAIPKVPGSVRFGFTPVLFGPRFHQNRGPQRLRYKCLHARTGKAVHVRRFAASLTNLPTRRARLRRVKLLFLFFVPYYIFIAIYIYICVYKC